MTRHTKLLAIGALGLATLAAVGYARVWSHRTAPQEPFSPSQVPGSSVPATAYRLSGPYTHANLTVFLVHGPETLSGVTFQTLQGALERKTAVVHETGSVGELAVENLSAGEELFVQSGDIVKGGKQDRTLPYDALVGPLSGRVPVASFCVEQGRWKERGDESASSFGSSYSSLSLSDLKRSAKSPGESSQAEVWRTVAKTQERLKEKLGAEVKAAASGSSLQLTLESPAVRAAVAPYLAALGSAPDGRDDAIGAVAVLNGRVVSADVYASRALFRQVWPKLLDGAAVEAFVEADGRRGSDAPGEDAVRAYLAAAEGGEPVSESVTERTYVLVRRTDRAMLFESCDRTRGNLVLHRSFLTR